MAPVQYGAADFDRMLEVMGKHVTLGAVTTHGLVRWPDEEVLPGNGPPAALPRMTVRVRAGVLAGLAPNATVTVDGVQYVVGEVRAAGHGAHVEFTCMAKGA